MVKWKQKKKAIAQESSENNSAFSLWISQKEWCGPGLKSYKPDPVGARGPHES